MGSSEKSGFFNKITLPVYIVVPPLPDSMVLTFRSSRLTSSTFSTAPGVPGAPLASGPVGGIVIHEHPRYTRDDAGVWWLNFEPKPTVTSQICT